MKQHRLQDLVKPVDFSLTNPAVFVLFVVSRLADQTADFLPIFVSSVGDTAESSGHNYSRVVLTLGSDSLASIATLSTIVNNLRSLEDVDRESPFATQLERIGLSTVASNSSANCYIVENDSKMEEIPETAALGNQFLLVRMEFAITFLETFVPVMLY